MTDLAPNVEYILAEACQAAGVDGVRLEVFLLWAEGWTVRQIRLKVKTGEFGVERRFRVSEIQGILAGVQRELATLDEVRYSEAVRRFPRDLVFCVEDRRVYDERPPDMRGVAPNRSSDRFQGARAVTPDHPALRQEPPSIVRHWIHGLVPVAVE